MKKKALWACLAAFLLGVALLVTGMKFGAERTLTIDGDGVHVIGDMVRDIPVEPFRSLEIMLEGSPDQIAVVQVVQGTEWKLSVSETLDTVFDITQDEGTLRIRQAPGKGKMQINLAGWRVKSPEVCITVPEALEDVRIRTYGAIEMDQIEAQNIDIMNRKAQVWLHEVKTDRLVGNLTQCFIGLDRCDVAFSTLYVYGDKEKDLEGVYAEELGAGVHNWYVYDSSVRAVLGGDPASWYLNVDAKEQTETMVHGGIESPNRLILVCPDGTADVQFKK